jgi:hypothetical protein
MVSTMENMQNEIILLLRDIQRRLKNIEKGRKDKSTWVGASWITMLTGWNGEKLRQARDAGIIKFRSKGSAKSYEYLVESIPEVMILQKSIHQK